MRAKKQANPERALQITIVNALEPLLTPSTFLTHFPAGRSSGGGLAGIIRGKNLKRMGLKPGVPDLLLIHKGQAYFLEVKADTDESDVQIQCHTDLKAAGARVATVRSLDDALYWVQRWDIPLRMVRAA